MLGSIFGLTRQAAFRQAVARHRFESRVRRLGDPFFIVCGYGQSGRRLVSALDEIGFATVVVESDPERAQPHQVLDTRQGSSLLVADARSPDVLEAAGLRKANCAGLVALTGGDESNQAIVIDARVLAPKLPLLARVKSQGARETLETIGDVIIVNPYETLAFNLQLALALADVLRLEDWLSGVPGEKPPPRIEAPRGHWVIAGYGRFGRAVASAFDAAGLDYKAIDINPAQCGEEGILGTALAEDVLRKAGIEEACGLVAGTDVDANNLAIVNNARRLRRRLFVVIRQNHAGNRSLIEAARADMEFVQSVLMTNEIVQHLTTPLLNRFLTLARGQNNVWAVGVAGRLRDVVGETVPHTWAVTCDTDLLGARHALVEAPEPPLTLDHLLRDPDDRLHRLKVVPLLMRSQGRDELLPDEHTLLRAGDVILFAGEAGVEGLQRRTLADDVAIDYLRTGREPPRTWLGRLLAGENRESRAGA
jgi:Trk K+ transport system NAD-binding subunit